VLHVNIVHLYFYHVNQQNPWLPGLNNVLVIVNHVEVVLLCRTHKNEVYTTDKNVINY
jgi:hypothetical protein